MADQTIEIRLIMRDELTKAMDVAFANMRKHDASLGVGTSRAQTALHGLARAIQPVHRELSSLARLSLGGLIGGGVVAGIVSVGKALQDMAQKGMQLHYTAQSLGVSTSMLNRYSDAMMAVGQSQEQGAAGIQSAIGSLRDLQVEGNKSSVWQQLEKGARGTGVKLARELMGEMNGPRGMEGALRLLLHRMQGMNPEAQRAISKMFGLGTVGARDLLEILPQLNKRIEMSVPQQRALLLANTNLGISWDNIKTRLASSLIPIFERLATSLDKFLQSPSGKEFIKRLEQWGKEMGDAFDAWLKKGGLNRAAEDMKGTLDTLWAGFTAADKVITDMGTSWPVVITSLLGLRLLAPILTGIGTALLGISKIPGVLQILGLMAGAAYLKKEFGDKAAQDMLKKHPGRLEDMPGLTDEQRENLKKLPQGYIYDPKAKGIWDKIQEFFGGGAKPQSGTEDEGAPKSPSERRADLQEKKRATKQLTDEFDKFNYSFAKLNTNLMPGGPEGGKGASGFQFLQAEQSDVPSLPLIKESSRAARSAAQGENLFRNLQNEGSDWRQRISRALELSGRGVSEWEARPEAEFGFGPPSRESLREREFGFEKELFKYRGGTDEPDWQKKEQPGWYPKSPEERFDPRTGAPAGQPISLPRLQMPMPGGNLGRPVQILSLGGTSGLGGGHSSSSFHQSGFSGLERSLAQGDSSGVSGSANVDIDVSGVGQSRDASALFRGAPMEGNVQMQDPPHVPNNPNNYQ